MWSSEKRNYRNCSLCTIFSELRRTVAESSQFFKLALFFYEAVQAQSCKLFIVYYAWNCFKFGGGFTVHLTSAWNRHAKISDVSSPSSSSSYTSDTLPSTRNDTSSSLSSSSNLDHCMPHARAILQDFLRPAQQSKCFSSLLFGWDLSVWTPWATGASDELCVYVASRMKKSKNCDRYMFAQAKLCHQ